MTMGIQPDIMAKVLGELGGFLVEAHELAREVAPQLTAEAAAYESACSQAAMEALRLALSLRDREPTRQPLRDVATQLGVVLDEADEDWPRLAYRALRVMLDAAEENARRDVGLYETQSPFFRSSRAAQVVNGPAPGRQPAPTTQPASYLPIAIPAPAQSALRTSVSHVSGQTTAILNDVAPHDANPENTGKTIEPQPISTQQNKPGAAIDLLLEDYFDLYIGKKVEGFTDDFGEEEVPDPAAGERWRKSSKNNMEVGKRLWIDLLGNRPIHEISDEAIREAKKKLRRLPEKHAKSCSETRELDVLIAQADSEEQHNIEDAVTRAKRDGRSEAIVEQAKLNNLIARIRVETILKHTRALNRPAKMLVKLGSLEASPFAKHMISNKSAEAMRKSEETRDRRPWDDRINQFLATPVFRGELEDFGDPMFWSPLLALLGGGREEEILQLSPDDFETTGGIHFYRLRNMPGNSIKSDAGDRVIPVHPELVRLGLIQLVELRRRQGEPRLFPHLKRGKHKETFTEVFTKEFTKYRQAHNVYWRGQDFHALRTTFHHCLMDNLVPGYVKRALMGHRKLDEGEKSYSQGGISMKTMHSVISGVAFNLEQVQSPFGQGSLASPRAPLRVVG